MACMSLIATCFNWGHIYFTFLPSVLMAICYYPDAREASEEERNEKRLR